MLAHGKHSVSAIITTIIIIIILLLRNLRAGWLTATPLLAVLFILTLAVALGFALEVQGKD